MENRRNRKIQQMARRQERKFKQERINRDTQQWQRLIADHGVAS